MTVEDYLNLETNQVYQNLLRQILENREQGYTIVDELKESEKYKKDSEFRANVQTAEVVLLLTEGNQHELVIERLTKFIEVLEALKYNYLLTSNLNTLANAYFLMGKYEHALEIYYRIIQIEKENNLTAVTATIYINIGLIYFQAEMYDKAIEHYELALDFLEQNKNTVPRYKETLTHIYCEILNAYAIMREFNKMPPLIEKLESLDIDRTSFDIQYAVLAALMYVDFFTNKPEEAKKKFEKIKAMVANNLPYLTNSVIPFVMMSIEMGLPQSFYLDELLSIESLVVETNPRGIAFGYRELKKYYLSEGNQEKVDELNEKYIKALEENLEANHEKQRDSLRLVSNLVEGKETAEQKNYKNRELRMIAEEAIRNKNELEIAYKRIEMIHSIGLKLNSSLNLQEVVEFIYENIRANMPLDSFVIFVAEPKHKRLRSLATYGYKSPKEEYIVEMDNPNSMIARCYNTGEMLSSEDPFFNEVIERQKQVTLGTLFNAKAALYVPIIIEEEVIGVYTVQSDRVGLFAEEDVTFLNELHPFISIALRNAIYSRDLSAEIKSHLDTQEILKSVNDQLISANEQLEYLAGIDQLTQINNRRSYEDKYQRMIFFAEESKKSLAVFMMDIDDFKLYNDRFGHIEGDEVLKKIAQIIDSAVSKRSGAAARFGGEEFIAVCIGLSQNEALELAEEMLRSVRDLKIENPASENKQISISIGIAMSLKDHSKKKFQLSHWADEKLYEAKKNGKDQAMLVVVE
ncbi:MAG: GGDEF domain-containing protein [Clostridiaceae bacterium]|nr:GGDEF domain-containing protein [Clostridiaceae bacterium]